MKKDGDLRRALFPLYENGRLNVEKVKLINHYMAEFEESKTYDKLIHQTESEKEEEERRLKMLKNVKRRMVKTKVKTSLLSAVSMLVLVILVILLLNRWMVAISYDGQMDVVVNSQEEIIATINGGTYQEFKVHLIKERVDGQEEYHLYYQMQTSIWQQLFYDYESSRSFVELMNPYTYSTIKTEVKRIDKIYYYSGNFDKDVVDGTIDDGLSQLLWYKEE